MRARSPSELRKSRSSICRGQGSAEALVEVEDALERLERINPKLGWWNCRSSKA